MNVKLSLQKKNYGLPLGETIMKLAFYPQSHRFGFSKVCKHKNNKYEYPATFQIVDSDRLRLRKGDIVQFSNLRVFRKDIKGQFGVILERYRIIKQKMNGTFKDYYAVVLIISGKLKGNLQHIGCYNLSKLIKQI